MIAPRENLFFPKEMRSPSASIMPSLGHRGKDPFQSSIFQGEAVTGTGQIIAAGCGMPKAFPGSPGEQGFHFHRAGAGAAVPFLPSAPGIGSLFSGPVSRAVNPGYVGGVRRAVIAENHR